MPASVASHSNQSNLAEQSFSPNPNANPNPNLKKYYSVKILSNFIQLHPTHSKNAVRPLHTMSGLGLCLGLGLRLGLF